MRHDRALQNVRLSNKRAELQSQNEHFHLELQQMCVTLIQQGSNAAPAAFAAATSTGLTSPATGDASTDTMDADYAHTHYLCTTLIRYSDKIEKTFTGT